MIPYGEVLPKALFGGVLIGDKPVRYIYIDEAGTSALEPVSVVVGMVIHADRQWKKAKARIDEILRDVPDCYKKGFIFHAKAIYSSKRYREAWSRQQRTELLHSMMSVPRELGIPIALGVVRRDTPTINSQPLLSLEEFHHVLAFHLCMASADKYIRKHADEGEVATVVAEDVTRIKRFIRQLLRVNPFTLDPEEIRLSQKELATGIVLQDGDISISRIVDTIHFVEKEYAPLLQLADACAFGFRRYFSEQEGGDGFVSSITGDIPFRDDWYPMAGGVFCRW